MKYIITAHDGKGMLSKRMEVRPLHLENLKTVKGKILCAGGMTDKDGNLCGSFLVMDFDSKELLDEYLKSEPYIQNKVWENIEINTCNVAIMYNEFV